MAQVSYINDLINSTWELFCEGGKLKDQIFDKYVLFDRMNAQNRVITKGGDRIKANLEVNTTPISAISGYEQFDLNPIELSEVIEYQWKEAVGNVIFSQKELTQNQSEQQIFDLVESKMSNLMRSYPAYMNTRMFNPLSTVAANEIHSIRQFIKLAQTGGTDDPSGLDRDTATYWRNQVVDYANFDGVGSGTGSVPDPATITAASQHLFMIDEGCLKFQINSGGNFEQLPMERIGADQLAWAKTVYFQGNLFMTGVRSSGLLYNVLGGAGTDGFARAANDLRDAMTRLQNDCTFSGERRPTIAMGTQEIFEWYENLAFEKRQFTSQSMADLTFDNFSFRGIPLTWDRLMSNDDLEASL